MSEHVSQPSQKGDVPLPLLAPHLIDTEGTVLTTHCQWKGSLEGIVQVHVGPHSTLGSSEV